MVAARAGSHNGVSGGGGEHEQMVGDHSQMISAVMVVVSSDRQPPANTAAGVGSEGGGGKWQLSTGAANLRGCIAPTCTPSMSPMSQTTSIPECAAFSLSIHPPPFQAAQHRGPLTAAALLPVVDVLLH